MTHTALKFLTVRTDKLVATAGAALIALAIGLTGAMRTHSAHAETPATDAAMLLPTLHIVAAADTTASGAAPEGFRARMRERFQERVQERKKEFEKEHPPVDKKLTHDQVRDIVAGRLAMSGNPNLKVGKVTAKEDGVIAVEIVTKTGALVDTREISTKTGLPVGMEEHVGGRHMGGRFAGGHLDDSHFDGGRGMRQSFAHAAMAARGGGEKDRRDLALTTDQARKLAEARLIMMGNKNLRVGAVKEKDADTISIDIIASDNSLVVQRLIDRHSGKPLRNG